MKSKTDYSVYEKIIEQTTGRVLYKEYKFLKKRKFKFDYAFPDDMLAIEIEGGIWTSGRHIRAVGFLKDMEKYNLAAANGWRLLRFSPQNMLLGTNIDLVVQALNNSDRHNV